MINFLNDWYMWIKVGHIFSVIAWMTGIFYLPRLFVYHAERVEQGSDTDDMFQTMERRLLYGIMSPAMTGVWIFGLLMVFTPGVVDWSAIWPWTKAISVCVLTWFHHWLGYRRKDFMRGENKLSGRRYRMMNELPTVFLVVILISVVVRPF